MIDKLVVGTVTYKIGRADRIDDDDTVLAQIDHVGAKIVVVNDATPASANVAVWHEAIHALLHQAGFQGGSIDQEAVVQALGYGIPRLLSENPEMMGMW